MTLFMDTASNFNHIVNIYHETKQEQHFINCLRDNIKNNLYDKPTSCDHMINQLVTKIECPEIFPQEMSESNCWNRLKEIQLQKAELVENLLVVSECKFDCKWFRDVLTELLMMRHLLIAEADCQNEISNKDRKLHKRLQKRNLEDLFPEISTLQEQCLERPLVHYSKIANIISSLTRSVKTSKQPLHEFEKILPKIEEQRQVLYSRYNSDSLANDQSMRSIKAQLEIDQSTCTKIFNEASTSYKAITTLNTIIDYDYINSFLTRWFDGIKKRGGLDNIRGFVRDVSWLKKFQEDEHDTLVGLRTLPQKLHAIRDCYDDCVKIINARMSQICATQQEEILRRENLRVQLTIKNQMLRTSLAGRINLYSKGKRYVDLIDQLIKGIDFNNDFSCLSVTIISRIIDEMKERLVKDILAANDFDRLMPHLFEQGEMNTILLNQLEMITGNREVVLFSGKEASKQNTEEQT